MGFPLEFPKAVPRFMFVLEPWWALRGSEQTCHLTGDRDYCMKEVKNHSLKVLLPGILGPFSPLFTDLSGPADSKEGRMGSQEQ